MSVSFSKKGNITPPVFQSSCNATFEEIFFSNETLSDLIIRGPLCDPSGYAEVSRNLVRGLYKLGIEISLIPDYWWNGVQFELNNSWKQFLKTYTNKVAKKDAVLVHLSTPNNFDKTFNGYKIGYTMFEAEGIPSEWIEPCNQMSEVLVPTNYNVEYFKKAGIERINNMPIGIDTQEYNPKIDKLIIKNAKSFKFLSVFQWTARKGWDKLLSAYLRAFTNVDDVSLVIKSYVADTSEQAKNYIRKEIKKIVDFVCTTDGRDTKTLPQILLYMDLMDIYDIPSLYNSCECYVCATRGEGIDLPVLQAGACEKPVITTRGTAHMAFLNDNNSYLINSISRVYEQCGKEHSVYKDLKIVDPDNTHLKYLFREVHNNYSKAGKRGKLLREKIVKEWDYIETAKQWKKYLENKKLI